MSSPDDSPVQETTSQRTESPPEPASTLDQVNVSQTLQFYQQKNAVH